MHDQYVPRLAAEVRELHADALEAARVAQLCQRAAGERLAAIRATMEAWEWHRWLRSDACPLPRSLVLRYLAVAHEGKDAPL